ncbi:hypothetical protein BOTBODRAFT_55882 [Botryobasidium botryosum FD-172 SS1]|uniref:Uncharacterized protein n=1 Tax=Botryobasidium botryosum (strain FD-172 SS1) TaxID=930990 RepID=A0A067MPT0_BOTB1|nr:hypothetical protein BOTBODRAFT_55882 [Botryobasidium botryosum FD-172 SS1]
MPFRARCRPIILITKSSRALALLDPHSLDPLSISILILRSSPIKITRPMHHGAERNVLTMTNLGDTLPLMTRARMKALGSCSPMLLSRRL